MVFESFVGFEQLFILIIRTIKVVFLNLNKFHTVMFSYTVEKKLGDYVFVRIILILIYF